MSFPLSQVWICITLYCTTSLENTQFQMQYHNFLDLIWGKNCMYRHGKKILSHAAIFFAHLFQWFEAQRHCSRMLCCSIRVVTFIQNSSCTDWKWSWISCHHRNWQNLSCQVPLQMTRLFCWITYVSVTNWREQQWWADICWVKY